MQTNAAQLLPLYLASLLHHRRGKYEPEANCDPSEIGGGFKQSIPESVMVWSLFCAIATLWFLVLLAFGLGISIHALRGLRRSVSSAASSAASSVAPIAAKQATLGSNPSA